MLRKPALSTRRTACGLPDLGRLCTSSRLASRVCSPRRASRGARQRPTGGLRIAQPIAVVASVAVFALMFANNFGTTESSTDACVAGAIIYWGLAPGWSRYRDKTAFVDWATAYFTSGAGRAACGFPRNWLDLDPDAKCAPGRWDTDRRCDGLLCTSAGCARRREVRLVTSLVQD